MSVFILWRKCSQRLVWHVTNRIECHCYTGGPKSVKNKKQQFLLLIFFLTKKYRFWLSPFQLEYFSRCTNFDGSKSLRIVTNNHRNISHNILITLYYITLFPRQQALNLSPAQLTPCDNYVRAPSLSYFAPETDRKVCVWSYVDPFILSPIASIVRRTFSPVAGVVYGSVRESELVARSQPEPVFSVSYSNVERNAEPTSSCE